MDLQDVFLETLSELTAENGISLKRLAAGIGLHHSSVVNWYGKRFCPRIVNLAALSDYFGCSIDYLFGLTDDMRYTAVRKEADAEAFLARMDALIAQYSLNDNRLAGKCRIGNSAIAKWRRFRRFPETNIVLRMADFFGCSIEYIIGRAE